VGTWPSIFAVNDDQIFPDKVPPCLQREPRNIKYFSTANFWFLVQNNSDTPGILVDAISVGNLDQSSFDLLTMGFGLLSLFAQGASLFARIKSKKVDAFENVPR